MTSTMSPGEKRHHERVAFRSYSELQTAPGNHTPVPLFCYDLSEGGLGATLFTELTPGESSHITLSLPDGEAVEAVAQVRWVRQGEDGRWRIGLSFSTLPGAARERLRGLVVSHG